MAENTIGQVYLEVIPTTDGISGKITQALGGESGAAGALAGNAFSDAFGKAAGVTGAVTKAVAGATATFVNSAMEVGTSFDKAMSQVAATSGKTMSELNESIVNTESFTGNLTDFAQEMGRTTQFSATQAAEALNYMALAGYDAQDSASMLPTVLNLAAAGDMELALASDMVTDAQSALGLSMKETAEMVDLMAKTASSSNTSVTQLGDAFLTVGPTAKDVAGGVKEMSAVLGTLANSGIKGSEAGTHLRNMLLAMNPTTDKAAMAWEQLGMSAYNAEGELKPLNKTFEEMAQKMSTMSSQERTTFLTSMFNKTDLASINTMLSATIGNADEVADALKAAGFAYDDFTNAEDGSNTLSQATADAFFALKSGALNSQADIEKFTASLEEYGFTAQQAKDFTDTFLKSAKAEGNQFDELTDKISNFKDAAEQMAKTQLDNLAGDVQLYESALESLQIAAAGTLTPIAREFVQFGTDALSGLTEKLNDSGVQEQMKQVAEAIGESLDELIEVLPDLTDVAIELIKMLPDLIRTLLPILDAVITKIAEMAAAFNAMSPEDQKKVIDGIASALGGLAAFGAIAPVLLSVISAIANIVTMVSGFASLGPVLTGIGTAISGIGTAISGVVMPALTAIGAVLTGPVLLAIGLVTTAVAVWIKNWEYIKQLPEGIAYVFTQAFTTIKDAVVTKAQEIWTNITNLITNITNKCIELKDKAVKWGSDMIQGFINGIKEKYEQVKSTIESIADLIASYIHFSEPDVGPLSNFHTFMPDMMQSMATGIEQNAKLPVTSIRNVSGDMASAIQGEMSTDAVNSSVSGNYAISNSDNAKLYDLMAQYLPYLADGSNVNVSLEGDAAGIFNLVRNQNNKSKRISGRSVLA